MKLNNAQIEALASKIFNELIEKKSEDSKNLSAYLTKSEIAAYNKYVKAGVAHEKATQELNQMLKGKISFGLPVPTVFREASIITKIKDKKANRLSLTKIRQDIILLTIDKTSVDEIISEIKKMYND